MSVAASIRSVINGMCARPRLRATAMHTVRPSLRPVPRHSALQARGIVTTQAVADTGSKVNIYADYAVYKKNGAVTLKMIKPTWSRVPSGSGITVAREGTLLLEFANAVGDKNYDWENKGTFALSAVECADVLEHLERGNDKISLYHDPSMGGSGEGQVKKTLILTRGTTSGWFLNLSVSDRTAGRDSKYGTALTPAEARLIRQVMDFAIPRLLGFDEIFQGPPEVREAPEGGSAVPI